MIRLMIAMPVASRLNLNNLILMVILLGSVGLFAGCTPPASDSTATSNQEPQASGQAEQVSATTSAKEQHSVSETLPQSACANDLIVEAYQAQRSDVQVKGCGRVIKVLADDNKGSRHQKFLIKLSPATNSSQKLTLLIAHNIDLAPRVADLSEGDEVTFYGEYEFNPKGGVVHWTHHDPAARHQHGWIDHAGQRYQ